MYLLGTKEIGKLIKELGEIHGFKLEYKSGNHDDFYYEKITIKVAGIIYTISCVNGGEWFEDFLKYDGEDEKNYTLERIEIDDKDINEDNSIFTRSIKIKENNGYHEFIVSLKTHDKFNEDELFDFEERNVREFEYSIGNVGFAASIIASFMKNTSLKFNGRLNNKNPWIYK